MPASKYNLKNSYRIEQGASFWWRLLWKEHAVDLTGKDLTTWSARMQIRERVDSTAALVSLTSGIEGGITLTDGTGDSNIEIYMTPDQTELLNVENCVYDLELEDDSGDVFRLLEGSVSVSLNVTR
jgi:hypothetical protein